jgi:hypothetical protein
MNSNKSGAIGPAFGVKRARVRAEHSRHARSKLRLKLECALYGVIRHAAIAAAGWFHS